MTPLWTVVAMGAAGGAGAALRFLLDELISSRRRAAYPVGTTVVNVTGSLVLGFLTGVALAHAVAPEWRLILGAGFLGGYTTFSTASLDTVRLAQQGRWGAAALNGFGMLAAALAAAAIGLWLGALV